MLSFRRWLVRNSCVDQVLDRKLCKYVTVDSFLGCSFCLVISVPLLLLPPGQSNKRRLEFMYKKRILQTFIWNRTPTYYVLKNYLTMNWFSFNQIIQSIIIPAQLQVWPSRIPTLIFLRCKGICSMVPRKPEFNSDLAESCVPHSCEIVAKRLAQLGAWLNQAIGSCGAHISLVGEDLLGLSNACPAQPPCYSHAIGLACMGSGLGILFLNPIRQANGLGSRPDPTDHNSSNTKFGKRSFHFRIICKLKANTFVAKSFLCK